MNWTKTPPAKPGDYLVLGPHGEKVWAEFNGEYWKLAGIGTVTTVAWWKENKYEIRMEKGNEISQLHQCR